MPHRVTRWAIGFGLLALVGCAVETTDGGEPEPLGEQRAASEYACGVAFVGGDPCADPDCETWADSCEQDSGGRLLLWERHENGIAYCVGECLRLPLAY